MANPNYLRPLVGRANRGLYAGKTIRYGNTISEMGNKTRRPWLPNVHPATLYSETLNRRISLKVSTHALREIDHAGGLDNYLLEQRVPESKKADELLEQILVKRWQQQRKLNSLGPFRP